MVRRYHSQRHACVGRIRPGSRRPGPGPFGASSPEPPFGPFQSSGPDDLRRPVTSGSGHERTRAHRRGAGARGRGQRRWCAPACCARWRPRSTAPTVGAADTLAAARRVTRGPEPGRRPPRPRAPGRRGCGGGGRARRPRARRPRSSCSPPPARPPCSAPPSRAGRPGFVLKSSGRAAIFDALRAAVRGDAAIGAERLGELLTRAARDPRPVPRRGERRGPRPARPPVARAWASPAPLRGSTSRRRTSRSGCARCPRRWRGARPSSPS